jgi:hypothetical protein
VAEEEEKWVGVKRLIVDGLGGKMCDDGLIRSGEI